MKLEPFTCSKLEVYVIVFLVGVEKCILKRQGVGWEPESRDKAACKKVEL